MIGRFLPSILTTPLHQYLTIIKPIECLLIKHVYGYNQFIKHAHYLFVGHGNVFGVENIGAIIQNGFKLFAKLNLGIAIYRNIQVAFSNYKNQFDDEEEDDIENVQRGHSNTVVRSNYAGSNLDVQGLNASTLAGFRTSSRNWQTKIGILPTDVRQNLAGNSTNIIIETTQHKALVENGNVNSGFVLHQTDSRLVINKISQIMQSLEMQFLSIILEGFSPFFSIRVRCLRFQNFKKIYQKFGINRNPKICYGHRNKKFPTHT